MKTWNTYPLLRLFLPFAAGIVLAINLDGEVHVPVYVILVLLVTCGLISFYLYRKIKHSLRWLLGLNIYILLFLGGYELTIQRTAKFDPDHIIHRTDSGRYCLVRLLDPPQMRERSIRVEAEILLAGDTSKWERYSGRVMLYFQKDSLANHLQYGDVLLLNVRPVPVKPPANPHEFDYRKYLSMRSVYHQAYVPDNKIISISKGYTNPLFSIAYRIRDRILVILQQNQLTGQEYAVTSALLIGYTEKLDRDLLQDYSGTGAMHILSVSGMHVGIVFIMLNILLFFMDKHKAGRMLKYILLILAIWAYAIVTGLSPAVLRAATMFSLVLLAGLLSRDSAILNNLAASAMILLLVNPYFIADIGFQLSYLAVAGMVIIEPYMAKWWSPRWWILKQIRDIFTVSTAATIATFPLCLYYFHQFPNYFLLTNLIAIPLSGFVMYAGMATLALSFIPAVSNLVAKVLIWLVYALNTSISFIEDLPGAVSRGLYINLSEMILLYILIIGAVYFFISKKKVSLVISVIAAIAMFSSFLIRNLDRSARHQFIVYSINKGTACDLIAGRSRVLLADSSLLADKARQELHLKENLERLGITDERRCRIDKDDLDDNACGVFKRGRFVQFLDKRIAFVNESEVSPLKIKVDYLILTGNPKLRIREVLDCYNAGMIIIDASNPMYKAERWRKECDTLQMPCYSVPHSGAFVANL